MLVLKKTVLLLMQIKLVLYECDEQVEYPLAFLGCCLEAPCDDEAPPLPNLFPPFPRPVSDYFRCSLVESCCSTDCW